ncbi:MAG: hypothetical protein QXG39_03745 [Candidatus Aenigmatarchaeota archaeon]
MVWNKSLAVLTFVLIGLIVNAFLILSFAIFVFTYKYHIYTDLVFEYDKSFSDLVMVSLLRLNYNESYSAYRILSERNVNGFNDEMKNFLIEKIGLLADTNCFRLVNKTSFILPPQNCEPKEYPGTAFIFKPYNPNNLIEEITLTYNRVRR